MRTSELLIYRTDFASGDAMSDAHAAYLHFGIKTHGRQWRLRRKPDIEADIGEVMPMIIVISKVPDTGMPYDTVADWRWVMSENHLRITHVDLDNSLYELLLWRHELDEAMLCDFKGVDGSAVDRFDEAYEAKRKPGDNSEPGDQTEAPYHFAHTGAELNERALAATLGVVWGDYVKAIDAAFERVRKARRG